MTDTAKYKIIESEKVSTLWCNGSTFTQQVRDPGSTPGGATSSSTTRHPHMPPSSRPINPGPEACTVLNTSNIVGESVPKTTSFNSEGRITNL
ncbi:hypothetical protein J6590_014453 [Homalodisca vitripennis]|nr:hypothetical protein J6590_014453 [Homalodisca vitripennis]